MVIGVIAHANEHGNETAHEMGVQITFLAGHFNKLKFGCYTEGGI